MPGPLMQLPVYARCDECGHEDTIGYEIDLRVAARTRKVFTPSWTRKVASETEEALENSGWTFGGGHAYCPECSDALDRGHLEPRHDAIDARGLVRDFVFTTRLHRNRKGGGR